MKPFDWNPDKNTWLQSSRNISFNDFVIAFNVGKVLDTVNHPNQKKYPGQRIFVAEIQEYCYVIPFVETEEKIFLKTIYRSRKAAKKISRKGKYFMSKTTDFDYDLDDYEKEIEEGLAKEGFKRIPNFEKEMEKYRAAAKATLEKTKNINIRISQGDLFKIKDKAAEQGIPYQTLISSLIHQYTKDKIQYNILREPGQPYQTFKPGKAKKK